MGMKHVIGVAAALAVLAMSACQSPAASPTPTPAFSELEGEALQREAIRIHQLINQEKSKYEMSDPPAEELPESLTSLFEDEALDSLERVYRFWREEGYQALSAPPETAWVRIADRKDGAAVATVSCVDARNTFVINSKGEEYEGGVGETTYHFRWSNGVLVVFDSYSKEVEAC